MTVSSANITVGLIGVGDIVACHLNALKANPQYKLVGICRRSPEKLKAQAAKLAVKGYTDYRDMLTDKPDVVLISLPHNLHYQAALDAIDAGCHVLVEKPIAISLDGVNAMIASARRTGRAIIPTESSYWLPPFQTARKIIETGKLGRLLFGNFNNHRYYFGKDRPRWFLDSAASGGGQFINIGVHRIAAMRCMIGDEYQQVSVTASVHRIHPNHDIEAATKAMVMYARGQAISYEECGYHRPPAQLLRDIHLVFENGMLGVANDHVWTSNKDGKATRHELLAEPTGGAYGAIYGQMLKAIDGQQHYPTIVHGARDVQIALAAYASAELKKTIILNDPQWTIHDKIE